MKRIRSHALAVCVFLAGAALPVSALAQAITMFVDIKTVSTTGSGINDSPLAEQLFLGTGQAAPLGTPLWFVADLQGNGLLAETLGRDTLLPSELLGADDFLLYRDTVDGDQPGSRAGAFRRVAASVPIPPGTTTDDVLRGHIYAILWDDPSVGDTPLPGSTFGLLDLGVRAKPEFGNPFWVINQPVTTGTFAVVPEPAVTLAAAAALAAFAARRVWHRRQRPPS